MTDANHTLQYFNLKRQAGFIKDHSDESFLWQLNELLQAHEAENYSDYPIEHPFIFIYGLPRSGTTLTSQLLAYGLDTGFINNFAARFWLAPLHGIRLAQIILDNEGTHQFQSVFARTPGLHDIHEFGYFWRHWLLKDEVEGVTQAAAIEDRINWSGLQRSLANMQHHFGKAMVFKNIFGAYHPGKLEDILRKVLYVYIERDPLDVGVSIMNARMKYYNDPSLWWSYMPPEYETIKDLNPIGQIAGQIYYLKQYYETITSERENSLHIHYDELTQNPKDVLKRVRVKVRTLYDYDIPLREGIPDQFPYRHYSQEDKLKGQLKKALKQLSQDNSDFWRDYSR